MTTAPALTGYHHLGLTVRDIEASEAWYAQTLGLVRAFVEKHDNDTGYAVVMTRPGPAQLPHSQLDQQPGDRSRLDDLLAVAGAWPGVSKTPSEISVAGARALVLGGQAPVGPPEAFMAGYEFLPRPRRW